MASPSLSQTHIRRGARLLASDDLSVTGDGHVDFEDDVTCGLDVRIVAEGRSIRIGARAWLGDNAEIRADVGANSIIASGTVVIDDIPANQVVIGNPARRVWDVC